MNKIEELEAQLMAERIKVQIDLKEKYKWVIGKYVKHDDSFMIRIDDICHVHTSCMNGYADNLEPDDSIYINGTVAHCDVKNNYYSLSKDENISDKKTAENFGCEYMDVDDFVKKYKS